MAATRAVDRVQAARQNLEQGQAPDQPGRSVYDVVKAQEAEIARALPKHLDARRFVRLAITELKTNARLAECTPASIVAGLMEAAGLGLEVSGFRGQAYLIPRNVKVSRSPDRWEKQACFQLGYRGEIDLAGRGGIIVKAETVRKADYLEVNPSAPPAQQIVHRRPVSGLRGDAIGYYCLATDRTTGLVISTEYWSLEEAEEHRDKFAAQRDREGKITGPWVDHFDSMAEKSTIRACLNRLPLPAELVQAYQSEAAGFSGAVDIGPITQAPVDTTPESLQSPREAIDTTASEPEQTEAAS